MAELEPIALEDLNQVADVDLGDEPYVPDELDLKIAEFFKEQRSRENLEIEKFQSGERKVLVFNTPLRIT